MDPRGAVGAERSWQAAGGSGPGRYRRLVPKVSAGQTGGAACILGGVHVGAGQIREHLQGRGRGGRGQMVRVAADPACHRAGLQVPGGHGRGLEGRWGEPELCGADHGGHGAQGRRDLWPGRARCGCRLGTDAVGGQAAGDVGMAETAKLLRGVRWSAPTGAALIIASVGNGCAGS